MNRKRTKDRGAALVITLMVAGVISLLTVGLVVRLQNSSETTAESRWEQLAFDAAVAGAERMAASVSTKTNNKTVTFSATPGRLPNVTKIGTFTISGNFNVGSNVNLTGSLAGVKGGTATYDVTATLLDSEILEASKDEILSRWRVVSTGTSGNFKRRVSMILRSATIRVKAPAGLSVQGSLDVLGNVSITGGDIWEKWGELTATALSTATVTSVDSAASVLKDDKVGLEPPSQATTVNGNATAGSLTVAVANGSAIGSGVLMFKDASSSRWEANAVYCISGNNVTLKKPLKFDHASGTPVYQLIVKTVVTADAFAPTITYTSAIGQNLTAGKAVFKYITNATATGSISSGGSSNLPQPYLPTTDAPDFEEMFGMSPSEFKQFCTVYPESVARGMSSFSGYTWIDASGGITMSKMNGSGVLIIDAGAGNNVRTTGGADFDGIIFVLSGNLDISGGFDVRGAIAALGDVNSETQITGTGRCTGAWNPFDPLRTLFALIFEPREAVAATPSAPPCLPNGSSCTNNGDCCSGLCTGAPTKFCSGPSPSPSPTPTVSPTPTPSATPTPCATPSPVPEECFKIQYDPSKLPGGNDAIYVKANRTWEWQRTN